MHAATGATRKSLKFIGLSQNDDAVLMISGNIMQGAKARQAAIAGFSAPGAEG
jgi:hypothetical protein